MRPATTRRCIVAIAAVLLWVLPGAVAAQTSVERYAATAAREAMAIARAGGSQSRMAARFAAAMHRFSHTGRVAAFALGPYRKALPRARRAEFARLVERFAGQLFATHAAEFAGDRLEIVSSRPYGPRDFLVRSRIHFDSGRQPSEIEWRVERTRRGLKVFDLKVLGIWLALRMRSNFVSILKQNKGDMEALFTYLRDYGTAR